MKRTFGRFEDSEEGLSEEDDFPQIRLFRNEGRFFDEVQIGGSTKGFTSGTALLLDQEDEIANAIGTHDQPRKSRSWKKFWEKHSGRTFPTRCCRLGCGNEASVAAHVVIKGFTSNKKVYLIPSCQRCNMRSDFQYRGSRTTWFQCKINTLAISMPSEGMHFNIGSCGTKRRRLQERDLGPRRSLPRESEEPPEEAPSSCILS